MKERIVNVAIDGPGGAGKSTIARRASEALGFVYVDTGAIYRTVGYAALRRGVDPRQAETLLPSLSLSMQWTPDGVQHMYLAGQDVTREIRQPEVSVAASVVSAIAAVRQFLLETQRRIARAHSVIMDGRDIGTVVLPEADVKIFLSASAEVRARRRWLELQAAGRDETYETVLQDLNERDYRDSHREIAPLRPAEDAVVLDTSALSLEDSVSKILRIIQEKTGI